MTDKFGTYSAGFAVNGSIAILGGSLLVLRLLCRKNKANQKYTIQNPNDS